MATTMAGIRTKFTDDLGLPLIGGQVFTYDAGTSTPKDSYSDQLLTVPNTNPIILDDAGSCDLYLKGVYRLRVLDVNGVLMDERDNVSQADGQFDSVLANTVAIGELQTSVANIEDKNVIKTDVSNRATGYGKPTSATTYASLVSDVWRVALPTGVDMGELIFTTYDTEQTINGATIAAGAYINADLIAKESITGDKIAKGSTLNAPKIVDANYSAAYAQTTLDAPNTVMTATGEMKRSNDPLNAATRKVGKNAGNLAEYDAQKGLQADSIKVKYIQAGDSSAPKIAYKKISGTASNSSAVTVSTGISPDKILSVSAIMQSNLGKLTNGSGWVGGGGNFDIWINQSNGSITLANAEAATRGNPYRIFITYEL